MSYNSSLVELKVSLVVNQLQFFRRSIPCTEMTMIPPLFVYLLVTKKKRLLKYMVRSKERLLFQIDLINTSVVLVSHKTHFFGVNFITNSQ